MMQRLVCRGKFGAESGIRSNVIPLLVFGWKGVLGELPGLFFSQMPWFHPNPPIYCGTLEVQRRAACQGWEDRSEPVTKVLRPVTPAWNFLRYSQWDHRVPPLKRGGKFSPCLSYYRAFWIVPMCLSWRLMTFSKFYVGHWLRLEMGEQWGMCVPTFTWAHSFCLDLDLCFKHFPVYVGRTE